MKKHFIISREGGDFSMDLIFAGLVKKFGKDNVIDYPARDKHRQGKPVLIGDDEKDYGAERRSLCYVEGCEDLKRWTDEEIKSLPVEEIGYVFMDETDQSFMDFLELRTKIPTSHNVVIVAGHDNFRGDPVNVKNRLGAYFKHMFIDDWQPQYSNYSFASLINLSCNFDHLWNFYERENLNLHKEFDICFIGYNSNPARKVVIDHIRKNWNHLNNKIIFEERPNEFSQFIRHDEMFKIMASSKICLNLPGASTNGRALRYYEIPYCGSFMLSLKAPVVHIEPKMGVEFENLEQLDFWIRRSIEDSEKRELTAALDHYYCTMYHTVEARMEYVFQKLEN